MKRGLRKSKRGFCRRSTFHVCFSYTFFRSTFWRFPVAQNLHFTSCYNETAYKQNTSLPFWHRFDVSDQDEKCLDISRFKWWMAIIVRSWKQGLDLPEFILVAEEAVFYTQTWTHSRKWSYMWVNAQKPHAKPCIAYFLQTQVRPLNFVMKRSRKHWERFWDYPTGRFFCC